MYIKFPNISATSSLPENSLLIQENLEIYCLHINSRNTEPCVLPAYTPLELVVHVIV